MKVTPNLEVELRLLLRGPCPMRAMLSLNKDGTLLLQPCHGAMMMPVGPKIILPDTVLPPVLRAMASLYA